VGTLPQATRVVVTCLAALFALGSLACSRIPPGRSAVDAITIVNAKQVSASDIENKIATDASAKFLFLFQGVANDYSIYDESTFQRDMARVERAYRSKGFLDAHARVARVFQVSPKHVRLEVLVDEGPATFNRHVTLIGLESLTKKDSDAVRLAAVRALVPGERFDEDKFKDATDKIRKALTDRGFAYAKVTSDAELDIGAHVIDYGFKVEPGPVATFGEITFKGLKPPGRKQEIPKDPLVRAIDIRPGSKYSTADIDSATQALLDLGVFAAVHITPTLVSPAPANPVVPLTVDVEPIRLREIGLGGGVELDEIKTDFHLVGSWEDHNFLGGLRDFRATFKPGLVFYPYRINNWTGTFRPLPEEWLKTQLRQPGFIEARTDAFIKPEYNVYPMLLELRPAPTDPVIGYQELKVPVGVERTFWKKLYVALGYNFQLESPFAYVFDKDPALQTIALSYPELVAHLDFRDNPVNPHKGIYLGATFQAAGYIFGGSASDVRIQPEVRTYVPVARGVTFATRASVGFLWSSNYAKNWENELANSPATTAASNPMTQTPADRAARATLERDVEIMYFRGFFSGGPTTNRGYPILGVAPHGIVPFLNPATASQQVRFSCDPSQMGFDPTHCYLSVGGYTLWEFQNELRATIAGPLSGAVFCDMSDVSPHEGDIRLGHLHLSCGLGAAYDTPVGPIRVDVGYRVQPLQVLGFKNEEDAQDAKKGGDPLNGLPPTIAGIPIAIAIGIGQAF
jgi:outer membrane protein insertion porin family/translocation and assembly module TamA